MSRDLKVEEKKDISGSGKYAQIGKLENIKSVKKIEFLSFFNVKACREITGD